MARQGFPVSKKTLQDSVEKLMMDQKLEPSFFKNNRPGRTWLINFFKRHPSISSRTPENLTTSRAAVTLDDLKAWADGIKNYLRQEGWEDILKDPSRIFNSDESAFFLNPKGGKVLAPRGDKTVYQTVNPDDKECLTVLITGNANGDFAPPLVVFRYERIPWELSNSVPPHWGIGKSESGWMNSFCFYEFLANLFHPWLLEKKIKLPVALFVDGHSSHLSLKASQFCNDHGILLIALHPNATHLIQPMDVSVFKSMKTKWLEKVHTWRLSNLENPILKKVHFCPLLNKVMEEMPPNILANGFRASGIYPWDPEVVKLTKTKPIDVQNSNGENPKKPSNCSCLSQLEKLIGSEKMAIFKQHYEQDEWMGDIEDTSLFKVWKQFALQVPNHPHNQPTTEAPNTIPSTICHNSGVINSSYQIEESTEFPQSPLSSHLVNSQPPHSVVLNNLPRKEAYIPIPSTSREDPGVIELSSQIEESTLVPQTPLSSHPVNSHPPHFVVPSPFKNALFFPDNPEYKKKRVRREVFPSVVSSSSWRNYHEAKSLKKQALEENRKNKAEERSKKKEERDQAKKLKETEKLKKKKTQLKKKKILKKKRVPSSSEEDQDWMPSEGTDDDNIAEGSVNSFLIEEQEETGNNEIETVFTIKKNDFVLMEPFSPSTGGVKTVFRIIDFPTSDESGALIAVKLSPANSDGTLFIEDKQRSTISINHITKKLPKPKKISGCDKTSYHLFPLSIVSNA